MKRTAVLCILLLILSALLHSCRRSDFEPSSGMKYLFTNENGFKEYRNEKDGSVLIYIPGGKYPAGANGGEVFVKAYCIMKYEVTNSQYMRFCSETGHKEPADPGFEGQENYFEKYPDSPVVNISYNDALEYCRWAGLRLPSEAEWEKAAMGGDGREYPWGNEVGVDRANYNPGKYVEDGYRYTSPVGSFKKGISPYGCYDMGGNVWEWCYDEYEEVKYNGGGTNRVLRGGSWHLSAKNMRCSNRDYDLESSARDDYGFRCAGD